jgi:hypothetical protein
LQEAFLIREFHNLVLAVGPNHGPCVRAKSIA